MDENLSDSQWRELAAATGRATEGELAAPPVPEPSLEALRLEEPAGDKRRAEGAGAGHGRLVRSAGVIGIATMVSRLLGLVREQVFAFLFGAGFQMDAFNVAFRIPNLLRDLFAEGAMSAAFVPTLTRYLATRSEDEAWRLANNVITALALVTGTIALAGIFFARPLVTLFAENYAAYPGKLELTVELTRIMFPFLVLVAVAAIAMGILNSRNKFFIPAIAPTMFNVAAIVAGFAVVPFMPRLGQQPIVGMAIGVLLGGLGQILIQSPLLRREGFRYRPHFEPSHPGLQEIMLLMGPGTIGLAAVQINIFVNTVLATSQAQGAVSWLNYAFRLMYFPIGLFGVSVATAALPVISRHVAHQDFASLRGTISQGLRLTLMFNVPATLGLIVLARPIIGLIYQHGRFTGVDTVATGAALQFYAIGLVGYSAVKLASPTFYALHRTRIPVMASAAAVVLNIILNITLVRVIGYRGLALGTAVTSLFNASLLLWILRRHIGGIDGWRVARAFAKIAVASIVMAVVAWRAELWLAAIVGAATPARRTAALASAIGLALVALAATSRLLRIDEFNTAVRGLTARFKRN